MQPDESLLGMPEPARHRAKDRAKDREAQRLIEPDRPLIGRYDGIELHPDEVMMPSPLQRVID